jgi:hypothetical protein
MIKAAPRPPRQAQLVYSTTCRQSSCLLKDAVPCDAVPEREPVPLKLCSCRPKANEPSRLEAHSREKEPAGGEVPTAWGMEPFE